MSYKAKGMNLAANPQLEEESMPKPRYTPRCILPKGRPRFTRLLDSWGMVGPVKAVVMPGSLECPTTPRISRKRRVSPLTRIAEHVLNAPDAIAFAEHGDGGDFLFFGKVVGHGGY